MIGHAVQISILLGWRLELLSRLWPVYEENKSNVCHCNMQEGN